ncbi:MAG: succinate dehydrogenase, cytochrome b556 subunit [Pseudomonadota bacterium]
MSDKTTRPVSPLSPHIQIYRWQWTMALSIAHRASGIALTVGTLLLVWWLVAAAAGPEAFQTAQEFIGSFFGQLLLIGWSLAFFYHLSNGVRHLLWDSGRFLELGPAYASGLWVLASTVILTALAWLLAIAHM